MAGIESGEIILWAAVLGLLIGIIWSLRYIVRLERRMGGIESSLRKKKVTAVKAKKKR